MGTPAMSILIKAFCFNCDFSKQPNQPICRNNTDPYNTDGEHFFLLNKLLFLILH